MHQSDIIRLTERSYAPFSIPDEIWGLWQEVPGTCGDGYWIVSVDDAPSGPTYLVSFTEDEAEAAARHQNETYSLSCCPVRIK